MKKQNNIPKVTFKFDIKKDARNYYNCANSDIGWGHDFTKCLRPEVLKKLRGKKWESVRKNTLNMLKNGYEDNKEFRERKLKQIQNAWDKINNKYFKTLEKVTGHKIYRKNFIGYITTIGRCPYSVKGNWFMVNLFWDIKGNLLTVAHEIMHLQIHHYFETKLRKKISYDQFHNLKEALTVLLNLEFKEIIKKKDRGYPNHKKLRAFITKQWKKNPDFDDLLDKCVEYMKKNSAGVKVKKK